MSSSRQSKIQNYMEIAEVVSKRSHDAETKVGSVLINNKTGAIVATGFNGFIRAASDNDLPNTRPDKYKYIIHSEMNLICNCSRHGISMEDCTLVCTLSPCTLCMRLLFNTGITKVIAKELYRDFQEILNMKDIKVNVSKDEYGFYHLNYEAIDNRVESI